MPLQSPALGGFGLRGGRYGPGREVNILEVGINYQVEFLDVGHTFSKTIDPAVQSSRAIGDPDGSLFAGGQADSSYQTTSQITRGHDVLVLYREDEIVVDASG